MNHPERGFLLVFTMLLSLILLIMGFAFLGSRSELYKSTYQASLACQARALARYGLEDARIKLYKDGQFPPGSPDQVLYVYAEEVLDPPTGGTYVGSYRVAVDTTFRKISPYFITKVTSTGFAGPRGASLARHTYTQYWYCNNSLRCVRFDDAGTL